MKENASSSKLVEVPYPTVHGIPLVKMIYGDGYKIGIGWDKPKLNMVDHFSSMMVGLTPVGSPTDIVAPKKLTESSELFEQSIHDIIEKAVQVISNIANSSSTCLIHPSDHFSLNTQSKYFIEKVLTSQNSDNADKDYLDFANSLLNNEIKYKILAKIYPMNIITVGFIEYIDDKGCTVRDCDDYILIKTIKDYTSRNGGKNGCMVFFLYRNHANALWFQNKTVWRYEPQTGAEEVGQDTINSAVETFIDVYFPTYTFIAHNFKKEHCIQGSRAVLRSSSSDFFCQDYSLLYTLQRIDGKSNNDAVMYLLSMGEGVIDATRQLFLRFSFCCSRL